MIFSSQQIIDCSIVYGNLGCAGGSLKNALLYLKNIGGIMEGKYYSYKAKVCAYHIQLIRVKYTGISKQ